MTTTTTAANVQTPTGMVHAGRIANVHGRQALVPACTAVDGYTGLRAAWETTEAVTCKKCLPSTRVVVAEDPAAKKARKAQERKAQELSSAEFALRSGEKGLADLLSLTPALENAAAYAQTIVERVADLDARRARVAAARTALSA